MTTDVIGQLPCPECNTTTDLKSDGRKHTLKCNACGVLAYYQTQQAKAHIEQRLEEQTESELQKAKVNSNGITLQLPEHSDAQQRFILSVEPLGVEPVNGELTTIDTDLVAANDDIQGSVSVVGGRMPRATEESPEQEEGKAKEENRGFIDWLAQHL